MLKIQKLDGKNVAYTKNTIFEVQTFKPSAKVWEVKYTFTGNLAQAVYYYNGINSGNGYAKRLVMRFSETTRPKVLAKIKS